MSYFLIYVFLFCLFTHVFISKLLIYDLRSFCFALGRLVLPIEHASACIRAALSALSLVLSATWTGRSASAWPRQPSRARGPLP
jgi:hypothetical protein